MNIDNIKNKKILVSGFGRSGIAATKSMLNLGAHVTIQDMKTEDCFDQNLVTYFRKRGTEFILGRNPENEELDYDMVILSPGVSPELPFVRAAEEAGAEITGELEIAYRISSGNYIAITGTNGKTTTTTLTGEIFRRSGRRTFVDGNIGVAVITDASQAGVDDWLITETSSFQLETVRYFKPRVSAILNLTPDHLDRHHTFEKYVGAKARIFENQREDAYFVTNYRDENCRELAKDCKARVVWFSIDTEVERGAFVKNGRIVVSDGEGRQHDICGTDELKIIGRHNIENALAASAISFFAGIEPEVIGDTIRQFGGVEHRLEYCGVVDGVRYYNDSKGTNTDATKIALEAVGSNVLLIAGGDAKSQDFTELAEIFPERLKKLVLLGRDRGLIREAAEKAGFDEVIECQDMKECVVRCAEFAEEGDTVLLSPACASWDMYDNYEQRGRHFKECVEGLNR